MTNSRFQDAKAAGLAASDVPKLKLKWALNLGSVVTTRGQPVVVGGRLFVSSQTGAVYALDADTGVPVKDFGSNGVVDLWGTTESDAERKAIRVAAETAQGVSAVNDNLVTYRVQAWT